jgi:RimJ/RimL family protein N-acetyltransferase
MATSGKTANPEVTLRPWMDSDLPVLVSLANNFNIAKNMTDQFPFPFTAENGEAFLEFSGSHSPLRILAIEAEGFVAGSIGIHLQNGIVRNNAELGYWIGEPYWGKGIASAALRKMVAYGFQSFPINRIFARPFGTNIASQRVLQKAGFILEGRFEKTIVKKDELLDELIFAIRKPAAGKLP